MNNLIARLRHHWQRYIEQGLGDYSHEEHTRDCDMCQAADAIEAMQEVVAAAEYWSLGMSTCACHCDRCRRYAVTLGESLAKLDKINN